VSGQYFFNQGYSLNKFFASFTKSTDFGEGGVFVDGQYIYCIATDIEVARVMIEGHYKSMSITCKEIELVKPLTTINDDLRKLSTPSQVLGYKEGAFMKTANAQRVLQLMGSCEDGHENYCKYVKMVSEETGISREQLDKELEPFV